MTGRAILGLRLADFIVSLDDLWPLDFLQIIVIVLAALLDLFLNKSDNLLVIEMLLQVFSYKPHFFAYIFIKSVHIC